MRNTQGSISYLSRLFTKDRTKKPLLCGQLCLTLWRHLTHKDVTGTNLCTDTDDTLFIQVFQRVVTHSRYVSGNFFWSQFGISRLCLIFGNMNGSIDVLLYQPLTQKYRILVVITLPGHKSDQRVLSESNLSAGSRRSVSDNLSFLNLISFGYNRSLVHTGSLVTADKFSKLVFIFVSIFFLNQNAV